MITVQGMVTFLPPFQQSAVTELLKAPALTDLLFV